MTYGCLSMDRRSSREEKGEEEGRDGDDALAESENEEEEEEDEDEEGDLWQAVHSLEEFRPIISFAASEEELDEDKAVPVPGPDTNLFYGAPNLKPQTSNHKPQTSCTVPQTPNP